MKVERVHIKYKNAFNCSACPGCSGEEGCPMWWQHTATDITTQNEILVEQCGMSSLPTFLTEVLKASNRPASEVSAMRVEQMNIMQKGFENLIKIVPEFLLKHQQQSKAKEIDHG